MLQLMQVSQVDLCLSCGNKFNPITERKLCMYALFDPFRIPEIMSIRFCNKKYVYVCANTILRYYLPLSLWWWWISQKERYLSVDSLSGRRHYLTDQDIYNCLKCMFNLHSIKSVVLPYIVESIRNVWYYTMPFLLKCRLIHLWQTIW